MRKIYFVLILICFGIEAEAQLNFKVGLSLGQVDNAFENSIIQRYNEENTWLVETLDESKFMPGIDLGLRYKLDGLALEVSWKNKFQNLDGKGTPTGTSTEFVRDLFYTINSYSAGAAISIKNVSVGASIDANTFNVKSKNTGDNDRRKNVSEFALGSHFHIAYELEANENLSVSLRPYMQLFWDDINLFGIEEELFPDTSRNEADFNTGFRQFGLMIVFYNGRQK